MDEELAIEAARDHAQTWGGPWGEGVRAEPVRDNGGYIVAYRVDVVTERGPVSTTVEAPEYRVTRFEFHPTGPDLMLPRWAAYPELHAYDTGWRTGMGEDYAIRWHHWFASLPRVERKRYENRFPAPGERGWGDFYEYLPSRG